MEMKMHNLSRRCKKPSASEQFQKLRFRKSQTEIMGLLVVIILLAVAMLFTVNYMVHRKPSTAEQTYTESQTASNILSSLLKTSTPWNESNPLYCRKADFTDLLEDCAGFQEIICKNGQYSCDYANEHITDMLNKTLAKWNVAYRFRAWNAAYENSPIVRIENLGCNESNIGPERTYSGREVKIQPIPLNPGTLIVQFDICS
jgi:hypothetical protein